MASIKKKHGSAFKAKVAIEAVKGIKTLSEIAKENAVHPLQVSKWKKDLLEHVQELFIDHRERRSSTEAESTIDTLYAEIGRLKVENDFLKKKSRIE